MQIANPTRAVAFALALLGPIAARGATSDCQQPGVSNQDLIAETEPNDNQSLANPLGNHRGFCATIAPFGDLDYFSFAVTASSDAYFSATEDLDFTLFDPSQSALGSSADSSGFSASGLAVGIYTLRVEAPGNAALIPSYAVAIDVVTAGAPAPTPLPFEAVAVPEPASLATVAVGLVGLGAARRRKLYLTR